MALSRALTKPAHFQMPYARDCRRGVEVLPAD
jgi:hypothetical protein